MQTPSHAKTRRPYYADSVQRYNAECCCAWPPKSAPHSPPYTYLYKERATLQA